MKYLEFTIENYRAIVNPLTISLKESSLIPLIGLNECGKTTILQAIYAFDYSNDGDAKHLANSFNLYSTTKKSAKVSALIQANYSDLQRIWVDSLREEFASPGEDAEEFDFSSPFPIPKKEYGGQIEICRDLETEEYLAHALSDHPESIQTAFCSNIVVELPYILYNDDFQDRPPSRVKITERHSDSNSPGWLAIYDRLFRATNDYSIFDTAQLKDTRIQSSILSDVQGYLNKTLSKTWKTFLLDSNKNIAIKLSISADSHLEIRIVESVGSAERFFDVVDRSKGFLWFFNFVMKLEFNPKSNGDSQDNIYLLDEPGSYLHTTAQEKLCSKLKALSERHGKVIYCTHSPHLLNPNEIPPNTIKIVSKSAQKKISVSSIANFKTHGERINALQPVYEALQSFAYSPLDDGKTFLLVEGIYDKYAMELFMEDADKFHIMPGTNADSITKNMQLLIGFGKAYIAIWDNDPEGRKTMNRASKDFGSYESERFDVLPGREGGKDRVMEQMFEAGDLSRISQELDLPENSTYETVISSLYFAKKGLKGKLVAAISDATKLNFSILSKVAQKRLKKSMELIAD